MADPVAIAPGRAVRAGSGAEARDVAVPGAGGGGVPAARARRRRAVRTSSAGEKLAALTYADTCVACHKISGEGGTLGPDLTQVATRRDAASIKAVIEDAPQVFGETGDAGVQEPTEQRSRSTSW